MSDDPDLLALLDQMAAATDLGPTVVERVHQDNTAGHIVLWTDAPVRRGGGREHVAFLDMGPVLSLWTGQGADLTPADARWLAGALTTWADRAEQR